MLARRGVSIGTGEHRSADLARPLPADMVLAASARADGTGWPWRAASMAARVAASVPRLAALALRVALGAGLAAGLVMAIDHALEHTEADRERGCCGQRRHSGDCAAGQRIPGNVASNTT